MKISIMEAGLYCIECEEETDHRIVYLNSHIKSIECEECHRKSERKLDPKKELYNELYERLSTKPHRISKEFRHDVNSFVHAMPKRVASKPYRLVKDINDTRRALKEVKHPS